MEIEGAVEVVFDQLTVWPDGFEFMNTNAYWVVVQRSHRDAQVRRVSSPQLFLLNTLEGFDRSRPQNSVELLRSPVHSIFQGVLFSDRIGPGIGLPVRSPVSVAYPRRMIASYSLSTPLKN